jgi:hypothetical protein
MAQRKPYRPSVAEKAVRLHDDAYDLLIACARVEDKQLVQVLRAAIHAYAEQLGVKARS